MKNVFLSLLATAVIIVVLGIFTNGVPGSNNKVGAKKEVKINETVVFVEVADTQTKRAKGLSGRASLAQNSGLLFVLDTKTNKPVFWMKDMLFPIDIIRIKDQKIIKIDENLLPPEKGTADKDLTLYKTDETVDYVLEVNAGFSTANNIQVGDKIAL